LAFTVSCVPSLLHSGGGGEKGEDGGGGGERGKGGGQEGRKGERVGRREEGRKGGREGGRKGKRERATVRKRAREVYHLTHPSFRFGILESLPQLGVVLRSVEC